MDYDDGRKLLTSIEGDKLKFDLRCDKPNNVGVSTFVTLIKQCMYSLRANKIRVYGHKLFS